MIRMTFLPGFILFVVGYLYILILAVDLSSARTHTHIYIGKLWWIGFGIWRFRSRIDGWLEEWDDDGDVCVFDVDVTVEVRRYWYFESHIVKTLIDDANDIIYFSFGCEKKYAECCCCCYYCIRTRQERLMCLENSVTEVRISMESQGGGGKEQSWELAFEFFFFFVFE